MIKKLTQDIFKGKDKKWQWAAIDGVNSVPTLFTHKPEKSKLFDFYMDAEGEYQDLREDTGYNTKNWEDSLIERDAEVELTGSDLARAMLSRGDKWVVCLLSDMSHVGAISSSRLRIIVNHVEGMGFIEDPKDLYWHFAVPINSQGKPLTAKEAGL